LRDNLANLNPNQVTVSAQADSLNGKVCVVGTNGLVASAQSSCTASLVCSGSGGGDQQTDCLYPAQYGLHDAAAYSLRQSATGVVNQALGEYPAFCYSITISNAGIETLTNIKVTDSSPDGQPNVSGCVWPDWRRAPLRRARRSQATHKVNTIDMLLWSVLSIQRFECYTTEFGGSGGCPRSGPPARSWPTVLRGDQTITIASGSTTDVAYSLSSTTRVQSICRIQMHTGSAERFTCVLVIWDFDN